ncbi:hypothetical protein POM88_046253 [Heracleum sosnowskyi]|uniref:Reverse transcriptase zinc-binding domain-containing protein n=1 Tax=Heracleum sosnowskyi TaxID=360622 RepID=A0AAD8H7B7_9APIA|nr:hypothetical protein POM88_046253 [Heracleum sosnowskyi]
MDGFNQFIDNVNLMELSLVNAEYTWFGPRELMKTIDIQICKDVQLGNMDLTEILRRASLDGSDDASLQNDTMALQDALSELYEKKVDMLRQQARVSWQINGDENSKFFHQCIQKHKSMNLIRKIFWKQNWISSPDKLKKAFLEQFSSLFDGTRACILFKLGSIHLSKLSDQESNWLNISISLEEAEFVFKLMAADKAPGPDGFNVGCLKSMWSSLKSKVTQCFDDFSLNGVTIGISPKKILFWDPLIKSSSLNLAGRVVLLKATLDSLPTHWLSTTVLPAEVSQQFEAIRRGFLWGEFSDSGERTRKMNLLKWNKITMPKNLGGLGISSLHEKNKALLGKWWYKWTADRHAFWNKFIQAKYDCKMVDDLGAALRNKNVSSTMLGISTINNEEGFSGALNVNAFRWIIKDGTVALFWEDRWLESGDLYLSFSRLFSLSKMHNVSVRSFCDFWMDPNTEFHMLWNMDLRAWELDEVMRLNGIINSIIFSPGTDSLVWMVTKRPYTSADGKGILMGGLTSNNSVWIRIWKLRIPPKIKYFLWKMEHGLIPTKTFLAKRMSNVFTEVMCVVCQSGDEDQEHLFWSCCLSKKIWKMVLDWWGFSNKLREYIALWNVHPLGAISNSSIATIRDMIDKSFKLFGYVDGSFKMDSNGSPNAGIGGYLKDESGSLKFIFSGPTSSSNALQTELHVVVHLVYAICNKVLLGYPHLLYIVLKLGKWNFHTPSSLDNFLMEFPVVQWRMPAIGAVKVNVSGFFSEVHFPNGNHSGIGVPIRNHTEMLLRLFAGSRIGEKMSFTLYLKVWVIDTASNEMARHLARYGAEHFNGMVRITQFTGRIHELWCHDMGLGLGGDQFELVFEDDMDGEIEVEDGAADEVGHEM